MSILDPAEAKVIAELLDSRQAVAAGELLVASKHRLHKSLRPHVLQCVLLLMRDARTAFEAMQLDAAARQARLAQELLELSSEDLALVADVEAAISKRDRQSQDELKAIERAQRSADSGSLYTVFEHISPYKDAPAAQSLLHLSEARRAAYHRYCDDCQEAIDADNLAAAYERLAQAQGTYPKGARWRLLQAALDERRDAATPNVSASESESQQSETVRTPRVVTTQDRGFVLDFGEPKLNTLVLFGNTSVIGAASTSGTTADIKVECHKLRSQHATIFRHLGRFDGSGELKMRYWIAAHPSYASNAVVVERKDGRKETPTGCTQLHDGDLVHLAEEGSASHHASLRFKQPFVPPLTSDDDASSLSRPCAGLSYEATPSGRLARTKGILVSDRVCQNVVFFDEQCVIEAQASVPSDAPQMPWRLVIRRSNDRCEVYSVGCESYCDGLDGGEFDDQVLRNHTVMTLLPASSLSESISLQGKSSTVTRLNILPLKEGHP